MEWSSPKTVPRVFAAIPSMIELGVDLFARMFSAITGVNLAFLATLFRGGMAEARIACQATVGATNLGETLLQAMRSAALAADSLAGR